MNGYWNGGTLKFNKHWQGGRTADTASGMYGIRRGDEIVVAPPAYKLHIDLTEYEEIEFDAIMHRVPGPLYNYGVPYSTVHRRLSGKKWTNVMLNPFIPFRTAGNIMSGLYGGLADKSLMPYDTSLWQRWQDAPGGGNPDMDIIPMASLIGNLGQAKFLYATADLINITGDAGNLYDFYFMEKLDDKAKYTTDGDKIGFKLRTKRYGYGFIIHSYLSIDEWDTLDSILRNVDIPNIVIDGSGGLEYNVTNTNILSVMPYLCGGDVAEGTMGILHSNGDATIGGYVYKTTYHLGGGEMWVKPTGNDIFTGNGLYKRLKDWQGRWYVKIKDIRSDRSYVINDIVGQA